MSLSISCSPKLRGTSTWLTLPQPDPRMMVHSAVTWRLNQNLKRSRINCISSGLPLKRPNVSSTEPWVSTNMDSNQKPVASLTSGLLLRSKIPGTKSIRLRTFLPAITSHRHYQYAGNCTRTHHWWWSHQHLLLWSKIKDAKIAKCPYWLEAFATRSAHSATISATSLEVVYNFLQKVIIFLRSSEAKDSVANDASLLDNLLRRANSPRGSADVSWFWRHLDRTLHAFSYATQTYSLRISFCQPPSER